MTVRNQILASSGSLTIDSNEVLRVPTGLQDQFGNSLTPHFVDFSANCPFLVVLNKSVDGYFDVWNPTLSDNISAIWKAHHLHSFEQEPLFSCIDPAVISPLPAPDLCSLPLEAFDIAYTPDDPALWPDPDPDSVQDALDSLILIISMLDASTLAYTPADPADWVDPDPDNVADALDRIAKALATHLGVPIL